MGHPLEKQFFVAFLCLSMATTIPATRKEDLERAAELAVERAAERAAERAVEKALEAGNTTSTTITVKESYSNARKTAEEQAAPGSESTRNNNMETSIFETKDTDNPSDYEPSLNGTDYNDNSESRDYDDEESSRYGDYNDSRGYSDHNDSRGYSDYNNFRDFREFKDSKSLGDYNKSRGFSDSNESNKHKGYNEPRGFGNYNFGSRGYSNSKNLRDPRAYNQSESYNDFGDRNYTGSKDNRGSNNNSQGYKDSKSLNDFEVSKGYEVKEDYSSFLNHTDYKKLNSSKSLIEPDIALPFGDFDWASNDSNLRHGFGSKLLGFGKKLTNSALSEDIRFYSTETDFSKKRDTQKEDEAEDHVDKDDSWKSYSDWKDFRSYSDETFAKDDEPFLKGYDEPFTIDFWSGDDEDSPHKSSRPFWADKDYISSSETKKEDETEYGSKPNPQEKGGTLSSTHKYSKQPFSKDYDFTTFTKSWQPDNKNSRPSYKSYSRRSSIEDDSAKVIIPPYHKRLSRDNAQIRGTTSTSESITTSTVGPTARTTERNFRVENNTLKETSNERYSDRSEGGYKEGSYERLEDKSNEQSKERFRDESDEYYKEQSYGRSTEGSRKRPEEESRKQFLYESGEENKEKLNENLENGSKNRLTDKPKERFSDESSEKYKQKSSDKSRERFSDESREEYRDKSTVQSKERAPGKSVEEYKEKSHERPKERRIEGITETSNIRYVLNKEEENVSDHVKTIPYELEAPPLSVYKQTPTNVEEQQPYTTYKVPENIPVPVPVSSPFPVHLPTPVEHQENLQGNGQGNLQGSSYVQFLQNLYDSLNLPMAYPLISRKKLKVPKPIVKQLLDPHEVPKLYSGQKRLPIQKEHQQVVADDRLPMLFKVGVPGPFPIENDHLQLEKPYSVPVKVHVENPYTIHLDKSIPLALKERIPFIIRVPLKPKENDEWSEARHSKKYENVPTERQTLIKRLSWV